MKPENRNLVIFIFLFLGVIGAPVIYFAVDLIYFTDYELIKKFESIQVGASRKEVIAKLGAPDEQDTVFHLGQYDGFEQEYANAEKSGSNYYLFWYGEIDMVYAIGFGERDQVIFKSRGGT